jgi:homoserine dehydrogenase
MFDKSVDALSIIRGGQYDVMVELTPINIMTGQPATDHVRRALDLGKHVITANKGPVAWHYRELRDLAKEKGVLFLHEATVMDGTPVYNLAKETLMGCEITEVSGIFNATTNFILTEMEKGVSFDDAVEEGRRQGFVEADASMDIDGWDAAAKLTALMNVLMDVEITPDQIRRTGIGGVTKEDIDAGEQLGGKFAEADERLCRELDIRGGVQVVGIKADGILARARVKEGFVITHINDRAIYSLSDLRKFSGKITSIDGIYPNGRSASYVLVK